MRSRRCVYACVYVCCSHLLNKLIPYSIQLVAHVIRLLLLLPLKRFHLLVVLKQLSLVLLLRTGQ
jgi:hypothetical protein